MERQKGELLTFAGEPATKEAFAVLQKLDSNANKYHLFLDKERFKANLKDWEKVPVVFAKNHPKKHKFRDNPEEALAECKGKLLGHPSNVRLETSGTPRLTANLPLDDPEVQRLRDEGKLLHSIAYDGPDDGVRISEDVVPDHVLVFPGEPGAVPGDQGALLFGPEDEDERGLLKRALDYILRHKEKSFSQEATDLDETKEKQYQAEIEKNALALKTAQDELKAFQEKTKAIETAKFEAEKKLKEFQDAEAKVKADSKFKTFMARVPKGWTEGKVKQTIDGKEVEVEKSDLLRKEFQADEQACYEKLLNFNAGNKGAGGEGQGQEHTDGAKPGPVRTIGVKWNEKESRYED